MIIDSDNRIPSTLDAVLQGTSSKGNFSGTLISPNLVLGSGHTTDGGDIKFNGINATVIYKHSFLDIALYKLNRLINNIEPLKIAIPTQLSLNLGNKAVGFSADFKGRSEDDNEFTNIVRTQLQTKLDIFRGASGGPVLNYQNKVVGVISKEIPSREINIADSIDPAILEEVDLDIVEPVEDTLDIKRFLNTETIKHYYTTDEQEIAELLADERFVEERSTLIDTNEFDLYKFWNTKTESYFYTRDIKEYVHIKKNLDHFVDYWEDSFSIEEDTLHRLYEPSRGYHFYTSDSNEAEYIEEYLGYVNEGFV